MGPGFAPGPAFGPGPGFYGPGPCFGPGPGIIAAEAACVGLVAGACIAAELQGPRRPREEIIVVGGGAPQTEVIVTGGGFRRPREEIIVVGGGVPQTEVIVTGGGFRQPRDEIIVVGSGAPQTEVIVTGGGFRPPREEVIVLAGGAPRTEVVVAGGGIRSEVIVTGGDPVVQRAKGQGKGKGKAGQPLGVSGVEMPGAAIEQRGGVSFFSIDVSPTRGTNMWRVMRRYNDFHDLHSKLGSVANNFPDAPFPHKTGLCKCAGARLEERRQALVQWLGRCLQQPQSEGQWKPLLRAFLEAGRESLATTLLAVPTVAEQKQCQLLSVEVPNGLSAGQPFAVAVPGGHQISMAVPHGATAGQLLQMQFDPASDKLTIVS